MPKLVLRTVILIIVIILIIRVMIISQAWYKADLFPVVLSSRAACDRRKVRERNHFATALYKFVRHLEIRISQKFELFHFPSPSSPPPFSYTAHFVETTGNELGGVTLFRTILQ